MPQQRKDIAAFALSMSKQDVLDIIEQHFAFETPEDIEKVCETFADEVVWGSPSRGLLLTNHDEILAEYRKIVAGVLEPVEIELLR